MPLTAGMAASVTRCVEESDTAIAYRSGDVPVLAEPPPYTFNAPTPADVAMGPMKKAVETLKDVLS